MGEEVFKGRVQLLRRSARGRRVAARAARYLLLAAVAITAIIGVREIVSPAEPTTKADVQATTDPAAESFALELARAYLSYDASRPQERERELLRLLPDDLAPDGGFVPRSGSRQVLWAEVTQSTEAAGGARSIVVVAKTNLDPVPLHLALQVARTPSGVISLAGYPALVGVPPVGRGALPELDEVEDAGLAAVARRVVANYLAGESSNLEADLLPGARVALPALRLKVRAVLEVVWVDQVGSGPVAVTVEASDRAGALYTFSYELGIERRGGRPYVSFIETVPTTPTRSEG